MSTKVKTPAQQTVTPAVNTQVQASLPKSRPFKETEVTTEQNTSSWSGVNFAATSPPPPDVQGKSATKGFNFQQIPIFDHIPATVQTKLVVGAPNDKYEQEADHMAAQVMAMSDRGVGQEDTGIQRQEEDEDINLKPLGADIQRQESDDDEEGINLKPLAETIQRMDYEDDGITLKSQVNKINRDGGQGSFTASSNIESKLKSNKGGGKAMPDSTRGFMESRFGNDFSDVKVHTDNQAVQMNRDLNAKAFTHGKDIYFNSGQYNPESNSGKSLLAHELTHTVQQTGHTALKRIDRQEGKVNRLSGDKGTRGQGSRQISLKPLAATIQRADYEDEGITLKPLSSGISSQVSALSGLSIQRGKEEDIKKDKEKAEKAMAEEIEAKKAEGGDFDEAEKSQDAATEQAKKTETMAKNAKDEDAAEEQGKTLESESEGVTDTQQKEVATTETENEKTQDKEDKKEDEDAAKEQQDAIAAAAGEGGDTGDGEADGEGDTGDTGEGEDDGAIAFTNNVEGLSDEGMVTVPKKEESTEAPKSPENDKSFQAVIKQTKNLAASQSRHKPAEDKAREAQEAAIDPNQQMRRAQTTQSDEAGEKEPGLFDREAFISSLLNVLGINKPKTQKDVASGKGAGNAAAAIKGEVDKSKKDAGGGLDESATRNPDPGAEEGKMVIPTPEAIEDVGEAIPNESVEVEGAAPKPKTAQEIEQPLAETADNLEAFVPKKIQTKLVVGAPGDKYELEADRMAAKVMAMPVGKIGGGEIGGSGDREETKSRVGNEGNVDRKQETDIAPQGQTASRVGNEENVDLKQETDIAHQERNPKVIPSHPLQRKIDRLAPVGKMIQLFPGILIQREALTAEKPTQEGNEVQIDQHRMAMYQGEAGVDASGALEDAKKHSRESGPKAFRQEEDSTIQETIQQNIQKRDTTNQEMSDSRLQEHENVKATQTESQTKDEIERARVSQEIQGIYDETKVNVNGILGRMDARVNQEFARSNARANARFERRQRELFAAWKHKHYYEENPMWLPWMSIKTGWAYVRVRFYLKRFFNTPKWIINKVFTGLPDEVNQIYEIAKQDFLEEQKQGVYRIADIVEQEMANAKAEVDRGRQRVAEYVSTLPDNLKQVGTEAASKVEAQFNSLEQSIQDKQNDLVDSLTAKYQESLQKLNKRIEALKAANQSFVSKAIKFIGEIAKWILKKILGALKPIIQKIPGIGSKAGEFIDAFVDDPGGFMKNLFKGIGQGFENFGKNILKHLKTAFFTWLLGAGMEIKFPKSFDLKGILDIVLQVLGLSKEYIFQLAGQFLPSWAGSLLQIIVEKGASAFKDIEETLLEMGLPSLVIGFFKALVEVPTKGIMALWDFIKDGISSLKEEFMGTIMTQVVIPQVVIAGIQWVMGLMNPASGIIKILKAVIDIIIFFINNIDTIKAVLASIGNTFEAVISGAVGLIAKAVEQSLADILPVLLGLFVSILGLGAIPRAVTKVIKTLRKPIDKTVGTVFKKVGKFFDKVGGKIKGKLGMGKGKEDSAKERAEDAADDIEALTKRERDPKKVEPKIKGIKSKYQLEKVKFKKPGKTFLTNKRYIITASSKQIKTDKNKKTGSTSKSKTVRRKAISNSPQSPVIQPQLEQEITRSQGQGSPLPNTVQASMESGFNHDFSNVKIHNNSQSDRLSRSLDAQAFTVGQDVYFSQGSYNPNSQPGKKLIAHELSHVVQQSGESAPKTLQRKPINWKDKKKALTVEENVSGSKKKAKLYIKAKLIDHGDILSKAKKKLKTIIKKSRGKYKTVRAQLPKVKKEFSLASISSKLLNASGDKYKITAKIKPPSQGKAQRKAVTGAGSINEVNPAIASTIQRAQGKGTTLSKSAKEPMENAFGYDFSPVRIHHNSQSDRLNRSLNAKAFTVGGDIFFRQGAYKPETGGGKQILAHELTHVIQQSGGKPQVMPDRGTSSQQDSHGNNYFAHNESSLASLNPQKGEKVQRILAAVGAALAADAIKSGAVGFGSSKKDIDVNSKIRGNTLEIIVKPEESLKKKVKDFFGEEEEETEVESEALPDEMVGNIVKVIIAIVNQSPEPDVVETKLDDVRRQFELRLVNLVSSAEIGNNYEYVIKVKGKAQQVKPKGIKNLLNSLKEKAKNLAKKAVTKDNTDFTKEEEPIIEKPKKIEPKPPTNNNQDTSESVGKDLTPEQPAIEEPKAKKKKDKKKPKEKSQGFDIDINTKILRIDDSTVDITVRANPQMKQGSGS